MNGYNKFQLNNALRHEPALSRDRSSTENRPLATAYLPYIRGTTDKISKSLKRHNINTVFGTNKKVGDYFKNIKDHIPLEARGVYEVPCGSCERTYVGETNRKVSARIAEHKVDIMNKNLKNSLAQHVYQSQHTIDFKNSKVLAREDYKPMRVIREAIEIEKREHALNVRDDGKRLNNTWKTALYNRRITPEHQNTFPPSTVIPHSISPPAINTSQSDNTSQSVITSQSTSESTSQSTSIISAIFGAITRSRSRMLQ